MKKATLDDYLKQGRLADCPICKLPAAVRKQVVGRKSDVSLRDVLPWLKSIGFSKITERQLAGHFRSGHERARWSFRNGK